MPDLISKKPSGSNNTVAPSEKATPAKNPLMESRNVIEDVIRDCHNHLGLVGEDMVIAALYVVATSRLLNNPLSAIVRGHSASGKSFLVNKVTSLMPSNQILSLTKITSKSLFYLGDTDMRHKLLVTGERSRIKGDESAEYSSALRQFKSEGRLSQLVTEQERGQYVSRLVEIEGPIAHIETTTLKKDDIFGEDLNRTLLITIDESKEQTGRIRDDLVRQAQKPGRVDPSQIVALHQEFQAGLIRRVVSVPFAADVLSQVPLQAIETRRLSAQILNLVRAVALLHQRHRQTDSAGNLVADIEDYRIARPILCGPLRTTAKIPEGLPETHAKITDTFSDSGFTVSQAQELFDKVKRESIKKHIEYMAAHRHVECLEKSRGRRPAIWKLTGLLPGEELLPTL